MTDYKSAHLQWIREHPRFEPKGSECLTLPYIEIMTFLYNKKQCTQRNAEIFFEADVKWERESHKIIKSVYCNANKVLPVECYFITLGFNHQTFTIEKAKKLIEKLMATATFGMSKCNLELHRENGKHPHLHIFTTSELKKGKIIQNIWSKAYVRDLMSARNWVDVKPAERYHLDYIKLIKKPEKMKYVDSDIEWRKQNEIPDYEFNWNEEEIEKLL